MVIFLYSILKKYNKIALIFFMFLSLLFAYSALRVEISSDFKKMLPLQHPYLVNMMEHKDELTLGNDIRLILKSKPETTILDPEYLEWVRLLTDEIYELPYVDKANIKSLWTSNTRWIAVTQNGFEGGEVIPAQYDGSDVSLQEVKGNIERSNELGRLVADDYLSTTLYIPLIWTDKDTSINYQTLNQKLEELRAKSVAQGFDLAIIGVAKKIGDLMNGAKQMALFFLIAVGFILLALMMYTSSVSVALILTVSGIFGVIWQLGLVSFLGEFWGFALDPYSMLVPFLIFAIAISHGLQIFSAGCHSSSETNNITSLERIKPLIKPACLALGSDAIGFASLAVIPIAAIQDLAITASLGVLCLFVTTLVFVPLCIANFGVSEKFSNKKLLKSSRTPWWGWLSIQGSTRKGQAVTLIIVVLLALLGIFQSQKLQIGDLHAGAPELKPDSRYNQDIDYFVKHYSQSADVYIVLVRTQKDECNKPENLRFMDQLQFQLEQDPDVLNTFSLVDAVKSVQQGLSEGFPKWFHIPNDQQAVNGTSANIPAGFINLNCDFTPIYVFLRNHKAQTLSNISNKVISFNEELQKNESQIQMLPAGGNAGIEAAVNESIRDQQILMLVIIYSIVFILCWLTFKRLWLVFSILVPLGLTSLLCQALMVELDIGVKVATLPVIALGVGIGVDYGVYIVARYLVDRDLKMTLAETGRIVAFTGIALAISVGCWMFSAIQFQADMGYLLTFMFVWNMLGALFITPAFMCKAQK